MVQEILAVCISSKIARKKERNNIEYFIGAGRRFVALI